MQSINAIETEAAPAETETGPAETEAVPAQAATSESASGLAARGEAASGGASAARHAEAAGPGETTGSPLDSDDRPRIAEELYAEMAAWRARDRFGAFRQWHRGSLSLIHLNVLTLLETEGPLPMHRIAETLDVSDASATGIVERIERRGLVERRHDSEDRRLVLVHLTEAGKNVFSETQARHLERLRQLIDRLGDRELVGLLTGIRGIRRVASELGAAAADESLEVKQKPTDR